MFISRIRLNPRSRQARSELQDPYQMHRTISRAFGSGEAEYDDARVLFRVDEDLEERPSVLVQSKVCPDWGFLPSDTDYAEVPVPVKEFAPALKEGVNLRFRLKANPTVRRDGKRIGQYKEEEQLKWLHKKSGQHGFKVLSVSMKPAVKASSSTSDEKGRFAVAHFDGILEVVDAEKFQAAWESGIGSAKAFGFGLLSLARV
ncbi:MAG: type I-E CRISPR-associated protein Cas6/Cse3/CasE [Armatimonadota bacterium]